MHTVPAGISPATAVSLTLVGPVAANQLTQAGLRPGHWVLVQGADVVLDATAPDFTDRVREATGGHGADIAVGNLGDPAVWDTALDALARGGTVVTCGAFLGGKIRIDLLRQHSHCHRIIGVRTGNAAAVKAL